MNDQYNAFTTRLDNPLQPITKVSISYPFDVQGQDGVSFDDERLFKKHALWDTGATDSVITTPVVRELGIQPIDKANVTHGQGQTVTNVYLIHLFLPNNMAIPNVRVSEMPTNGAFDVIVGMSILRIGNFSISNYNNAPHLSFIAPSNRVIDHVSEAKNEHLKREMQKASQNQKCPCGSGKKFKNCHGKHKK